MINENFSKEVLHPYCYKKESRTIERCESGIEVKDLYPFVLTEFEKIDRTWFMRNKTKKSIKIGLIKRNLNLLLCEFNYYGCMSKISTSFKEIAKEESFKEFMEETILKVSDKCIPLDSIFKYKYYMSDESMKEAYLIANKGFKKGEYLYEEFLFKILTDLLCRYSYLHSKSDEKGV